MLTNLTQTQEKACGILAHVMHDLNPARSVKEWKEHIMKTGDDPIEFFNGNGEGLQEYDSFINHFDKAKYERNLKKARI